MPLIAKRREITSPPTQMGSGQSLLGQVQTVWRFLETNPMSCFLSDLPYQIRRPSVLVTEVLTGLAWIKTTKNAKTTPVRVTHHLNPPKYSKITTLNLTNTPANKFSQNNLP